MMRNIWIGLALLAIVALLAWLALGGKNTAEQSVSDDTSGVHINRSEGERGKPKSDWQRDGSRAAVGTENQVRRNGGRYGSAKEKSIRERMKIKPLSHDELVSRQEDFEIVGEDIILLAEQYEAEGDYKKAYETMLPYHQTSNLKAQMYTDKLRKKYFAQTRAESLKAQGYDTKQAKH